MIHGHGSDAYKYEREVIADFSSNVWYKGPPETLIDHLSARLKDIKNYPEPDSGSLKVALAELYKLDQKNILVTNGSAEAIYLLARWLPMQKSVIYSPTFAEYEDACRLEGHDIQHSRIADFEEITMEKRANHWICNPNNPTGTVLSARTIERKLVAHPEATFIVDEAYVDLCTNDCSCLQLIQSYPNLIILKSFTKAFTIPGIRLGIVLAHPEMISKMQSALFPWNVNSLAIEAGLFICSNIEKIKTKSLVIEKEMTVFKKMLKEIEFIDIHESQTNYCLCSLRGFKAAYVKDYLMRDHGILIRDASNFHGLNDRHIRLALQSEAGNELLTRALNDLGK